MKNFDFPFNLECPTCRNDLKIGPPEDGRESPLKNQRIAGALRTFLTSGSLTSGHLGFVGIEPFTNRLYDNLLKTLSQRSEEFAENEIHSSSKEGAMGQNSWEMMNGAQYRQIPHKT